MRKTGSKRKNREGCSRSCKNKKIREKRKKASRKRKKRLKQRKKKGKQLEQIGQGCPPRFPDLKSEVRQTTLTVRNQEGNTAEAPQGGLKKLKTTSPREKGVRKAVGKAPMPDKLRHSA